MNTLHEHAGKIGATGTLAAITAQEFSHYAAGAAALATVAAILPVVIRRWRHLFRR